MHQPPDFLTGDEKPVERVSWLQAQKYCEEVGGQLPTEAEWEYAARGSTRTPRYGQLTKIAWYIGNSGRTDHRPGEREANEFRLFDMLGNVAEWVRDDYATYETSPDSNPQVDPPTSFQSGGSKIVRGGSFIDQASTVRASYRQEMQSDMAPEWVGFRCVVEIK